VEQEDYRVITVLFKNGPSAICGKVINNYDLFVDVESGHASQQLEDSSLLVVYRDDDR
jgi:hypothetical protein